MEIKDSFEYSFKKPFKYSNNKAGGVEMPSVNIVVQCPSKKVLKSLSVLESEFMQAIQKAQQFAGSINQEAVNQEAINQENDKAELKGSDAVMAIVSYGDISKCYDNLETILSKTALIDGEQPYTTAMDISPYDLKGLLGEYLENFILPSLLS